MGTEIRQAIMESLERDTSVVADDLGRYRVSVLKKTLFKKFLGNPQDTLRLEREAVDRFLSNNERLSNLKFDPACELIRYVKDELYTLLCSGEFQSSVLSLTSILQQAHCGPGASIGLKETSYLHKMFNSNLTTTSRKLYAHYCANISEKWKLANRLREQHHSTAIIGGSKLSTVPKDESKRRNICTEPVLNMFYQLGAKEIIEDRLTLIHNLDVSAQPTINQSMARDGSINGRFATLDLSDASDSISLNLARLIIPADALWVLEILRSTKVTAGSNQYDLNMFSTMGNGFTFPLMTAIFSSIVRAVYRLNDIHPRCGTNYSVFGDDIIVLNDLYSKVVSSLESLGFIVNIDKSFSTGFFRESCGGDFYHGHDVRGVYIKELNNEAQFYSSYNRLLRWSVLHGIDLSWTLACLLKHVPIRFVSQFSSSDSGIIAPRDTVWFYPRDKNGSIRFRRMEPVPRRVRVRDNFINPVGAEIAFLGGYIRSMMVTSRCNNQKYKVVKRVCPCWNSMAEPFNRWSYNQEMDRFIKRSLECLTLIQLECALK